MDSNIFCENEEKSLDYSKKVYYFDGVEKHEDFFKKGAIRSEKQTFKCFKKYIK